VVAICSQTAGNCTSMAELLADRTHVFVYVSRAVDGRGGYLVAGGLTPDMTE